MIGKILFLSAAAFLAYRYIGNSNRKARALNEKRAVQEILPPAAEEAEVASSARLVSMAAEPDPGR